MANIQSIITNGNGNVLIGTTTDNGSKLNVNGSYYGTGNITLITAGYPLIDLGVTTSNYFRINFDNPNDRLLIGKNGASSFILNASGSAVFSSTISATKGQFSDASGAGSVLEVYNTVATNATTAIIRQTTAGGNGNQDIGLLVDIQGAGDTDRIANFRYYDGSTYTSRMAILRGGNVGIGTTAPVSTNLNSSLTIYKSYNGDTASVPSVTAQNYYENQSGLYLFGRNSGLTIVGSNSENNDIYFANASNKAYAKIGALTGTTSTGGDMYFNTGGDVEAMRITTSGNVGIGTTNPANRRLVVSSNINDEWVGSFIHTGTNPYGLFVDTTANTSGGFTFAAYTFAGGGFYVRNSGNVLIGTSTDSGYKLDVNGSARVDNANGLTISGFSTGTGLRLNYGNSSGEIQVINLIANGVTNGYIGLQMVDSSNGDMWFGTTAGRTMTIYRNGNVGIGTTEPGAKLDVLGLATIRNSSAGGVLNIGTSSGRTQYQYINLGGGNGGTDYGWQVGRSPQTGGVINDGFYIYDIKTNNAPFAIALGGNVLINTTTDAGYKLDVSGNIRAYTASSGVSPRLDLGGTIIAEGGTRAGLYILTSGTAAGSYGSIWWGNGNTNTDAYISVGNDTRAMAFGTADGERMRITSGGNVGIGVTPSAWSVVTPTLQIGAGGAFIGGQGSANVVRVGVNTYYDGSVWRYINTGSASWFETASGAFGWFNAISGTAGGVTTTGSLMTLTAGGNLLIGTTTDSGYKLDVNGGTAIRGDLTFDTTRTITSNAVGTFLLTNPADAGIIELNAGTTAAYKTKINVYGRGNGNGITFTTQDAERMRITDAGNVGINTTAPQQLLHVLGATNGYAMIQGANDAGQAGIYFKKEDTTGTMDRTKGLIVFHTNVGSGWGRGNLGFCLNSADSNAVVSVSDEKFRMVDNGDFLADGDVVAYSTTISDARYKTNIQPIESALDKVNQMRGVSFDWTAVRSGREFGVIAQEIEQIAPEVVSEKELLNGDTMKTVSYTSLVPFLIESIKELTAKVAELESKLNQK